MSTSLDRIRTLSRRMLIVIHCGLAFESIGLVALWVWPSLLQKALLPTLRLEPSDVTLSPATLVLGFLVALPLGLLTLSILWDARALFRAYAQGEIFALASIRFLRRIAFKTIALVLLQPITRTLIVLALTLANPPGHRLLSIDFTGGDYSALAMGGLLLAVSWVMVEAASAHEENKGFV